MEQELLKQAINSILHGSVTYVSQTDGYGNTTQQELRVGDLRIKLVDKLAEKLVQTPEFKATLEKAFTGEIIKKIQDSIINATKFSDLPYQLQQKIQKDMNDAKVEVREYTVVAKVIESDK